MNSRLVLVFLLSAFGISNLAAEAVWPRWRGPSDSGSTPTEGDFPQQLLGDNIAWKIELPGKGASTPIIWGEHIFVTGQDEGQDVAIALDLKGKELWRTEVGEARDGKHRNGSSANPSIATDGEFLFAYFKSGNLAAMKMDGAVLWQTNIQETYGKFSLYWDLGTSPVVTEKHVVIAAMHGGPSYLVAFDKATGEEAWKVDRTYEVPVENDHSYSTPLLVDNTIYVWGSEHFTAHSAQDGKKLWDVGEFNPEGKKNWVVCASFVISDGIAVTPYGRGAVLHGVSLEGERLWVREGVGSFVPTPVVYNGNVYVLGDSGEVECVNPKNGESIWKDKLPRSNAKFYSSPTIAGGLLYAGNEKGVMYVVNVADGFELVSENDFGEQIIASPVPVGQQLLVRTALHLYCIGK
ncbi:MAG: outer membrane protein assembly factor BamB [Verrucomicrobiales bacterium]|jgi:outer membrane protein assembly factor BamB